MALKPVDILNVDLDNYEPVDSSKLNNLAQFGLGLATRAVQKPLEIAEIPFQKLHSLSQGWAQSPAAQHILQKGLLPAQEAEKIQQKAQEKYEPLSEKFVNAVESQFGKESIEPSNIVSQALQYSAGNWPLLFAGGIPTLGKVGADIAGSLGMSAAHQVTHNPIVGIAAHILGTKGFNSASNWLKNIKTKDPSKISEYISSLYDQEKDFGSKIKVNPDPIIKKLDEINNKVNKQYLVPSKFDEAARNRVLNNLSNAGKSLDKPNLSASDLAAEKRILNSVYSSKDSIENKFYKDIRGAFSEELDDLSKAHKQWGNIYKTSDELYSIDKWQSGLNKTVQNLTSKGKLAQLVTNPIAHSALGILTGLYKGTPYGLVVGAGPSVVKGTIAGGDALARGSKFLYSLGKTDSGRKLLMDIVVNGAKDNSDALIKNINALNKKSESFEKDQSKLKEVNPNLIDWKQYESV